MEPMLKVIATLCSALFTGGALYVSLVEPPARMADMVIALREFQTFVQASSSMASLYCRDLLSDGGASVGFDD
jgi:hypothetical protein